MRTRAFSGALACAMAAAATACGGAGGGSSSPTQPNGGTGGNGGGINPTPTTGTNVVNLLDNNSFSPNNLAVSAGVTVTWKWGQCTGDGYSGCVSHNVTFDDGTNIASQTQTQGEYTRTFTTPGT